MIGMPAIARVACLLLPLVALAPCAVAAEGFPSRPLRLVVGAPAGGTTDTIARAIAVPMAEALGQPVLVDNRAGAGGNIAAEAVAKAPPDGHVLLVCFTSHAINASLYPRLPFDPVADFTPITRIATVPSLLVGRRDLPAADLAALIALARAQPGRLTLAVGGLGSSLHLAGEQFKLMTGTQLLNVPYKGTAPALTDLLGGQVDLMFVSLVTGAEQVAAGKLRAYGVTSAQRLAAIPDLPAIAEQVAGFESSGWFGLLAPAGLPAPVLERLHAVVVAALRAPELRARLQQEGATPVGDGAADFAAFLRRDIDRWTPIVRASGATPN
jgi:tripartite-type tricarboxylate transporter receptor subunit TctC